MVAGINKSVRGWLIGVSLMSIVLSCLSTALAQADAAWQAYQSRDYETARELWEQQAESGDADAAYNLGVMFAEGRGVQVDFDKARQYWRKAADGLQPQALHALGSLYLSGDGVDVDPGKARDYFRQSANLGSMRGQYAFAKLLMSDGGGALEEEAFEWMLKSAKAGFKPSQHNLGKLYRDGIGTTSDIVAAVAWFRVAADQGYAPSQHNLASRLNLGDGIAQDKIAALKWAILAARRGLDEAQNLESTLRRELSAEEIAEAEAEAATFEPKVWRYAAESDG